MTKKQTWAFWANKFGPWYKTPQRVNKDGWHKDGDANVEKLGLQQRRGYICFASNDKKEVQRFMDGFNSCRNLLKDFFDE